MKQDRRNHGQGLVALAIVLCVFLWKIPAVSALQIRRELHDIIEVADDKLVAAIYVLLQSLLQNDTSIVGFTGSGKPLTKEEFIARIRESHAVGNAGKVKTAAELLEEIQTW